MAGKSSIKGITIEIGGNTEPLQKALSDVNKRSNQLKSELSDVERLLKFNPNNVEALAQKQKLLTEQVGATTEKLNKLKAAEQQVQDQFEQGKISEERYRAFRREIEFTEVSLKGLKNRLSEMNQEQEKVQNSSRQLKTLFEATGKSVDDFSDVLGTRLSNAIRDGTATSKQLEEALDKIGKAALGADTDLDKMRQALSRLDSGSSISEVRRDLQQVGQDADEAEGQVKELGSELTNLVAGAAAGLGINDAIEKALDVSSLNTKIEISMDVPEKSKQSIKDAVNTVSTYGVDAESALEGVRRQWVLNKNASDESNQAVVTMAGTIAAAYSGVDFTELIQEGNEIAATLGITNEEAMGLVNTLVKTGFPPEQLDTIAEYGDQMIQAGFSAKEVQAIMAAGVDTKSWSIDNLLDGVKEGRIQLADFGSGLNKDMEELISKTNISADQFVGWGKSIAQGGEGGQQAMLDATKALAGVEDATVRNQIGTKMFGTMWEDQGSKIIATITNAAGKNVDLKKGIDDLNTSTENLNADPMVAWGQAMKDLQVALSPLLSIISEIISKIAEWIQNNPGLASTIITIVSVLGILIGIAMGVAPIFTAIAATAAAAGVSIGAIAWPVIAVIAGITALIAIGVYLYKNWDTLIAKAGAFWDKLGPLQGAVIALSGPIGWLIAAGVKLYQNWDTIREKAGNLRDKIAGLFDGIKWKLPDIKLPHFKLSGKFDLTPPDISVPKVNVDWYKNGGLFPANSPRLVGMGDANVPEAALPLSDSVLGKIAGMISEHIGSSSGGDIVIQQMVVREEADIQKISRELNRLSKSKARGKGVIMT